MDHNEIEMCHGGSHNYGHIVGFVQGGNKFCHEVRNRRHIRPLVNDFSAGFMANEDRSWSPSARVFCQIEAHHHVMQAADGPVIVYIKRIVRELKNIAHGRPITAYGAPRLRVRVQGFFALNCGHCILKSNVISLDAV